VVSSGRMTGDSIPPWNSCGLFWRDVIDDSIFPMNFSGVFRWDDR
jgi:hypothetical protein